MRTGTWALCLSALFVSASLAGDGAAPPGAAAEARVVPLHRAVASGKVRASGTDPRGYEAVTLHLRNTTQESVAVDIAGSYLTPTTRGECQRLGLGPPVTPGATTRVGSSASVVVLAPGEERQLVVGTCCLDLGLPSPSAEKFEASPEALPDVRTRVLKWWARNPQAPQGAVNAAIWQNSSEVRVEAAAAAQPAGPKSRSATMRNGVYYRLVGGELTSVGTDGVTRLLGNGIERVLPAADGLYSVMMGARGSALFRLQMTGEQVWTQVMDLAGDDRVHEVLNGRHGDLVVVTDRGVTIWDAAARTAKRVIETNDTARLSVHRAADDRLSVTLLRPAVLAHRVGGKDVGASQQVFELWNVSLDTRKAERDRGFWNVDGVVAGAGGVFALAPSTGGLRRLAGNRFVDTASSSSWTRIVAVTDRVVWLEGADGNLAAADPATGRVRFTSAVKASEAGAASVDPKTGDLAYVRGEEFRLVCGGDGTDEAVPKR